MALPLALRWGAHRGAFEGPETRRPLGRVAGPSQTPILSQTRKFRGAAVPVPQEIRAEISPGRNLTLSWSGAAQGDRSGGGRSFSRSVSQSLESLLPVACNYPCLLFCPPATPVKKRGFFPLPARLPSGSALGRWGGGGVGDGLCEGRNYWGSEGPVELKCGNLGVLRGSPPQAVNCLSVSLTHTVIISRVPIC